MTQFVGSSSYLVKNNPTATQGQKQFVSVYEVPVGKPVLVIFGGALTTTDRKAYGYIEHISQKLPQLRDVDVYSAVYQFESVDPMLVKIQTFRRAGRKIALDANAAIARKKEQQLQEINANEPTPGYIEDLYDTIIAPRIIPRNQQATLKNMRDLVIYSHCHGAIVVKLLGDMATINMQKAGFTPAETKEILANTVAIQHNPTAPLENHVFTTLNFASATDDTLDYHDDFSKRVLGRQDIEPTFMGDDYANLFLASKLNKDMHGSEHGFSIGYQQTDESLTDQGKVIFAAQRNALVNALNRAKEQQPLQSPQDMTKGDNVNFAELLTKAKAIMSQR